MPEIKEPTDEAGRLMSGGEQGWRRVAVIYNPIKVSDEFRSHVEDCAARGKWADPLWLETSEDDPGRGMVQQAKAEQADLVVCAGGDGTVRIVADGLARSGIPMGVPSGRLMTSGGLAPPLFAAFVATVRFAAHRTFWVLRSGLRGACEAS